MTAIDVADELSVITRKYRDPRQLKDLEGALRGLAALPPTPGPARQWATVNLHEVFLSEESPLVARRSWPLHVLDVMVEVLVFFPVVVTWFGLAKAFDAYRSAARANALGGQSFLQAWENGFGGRLPGWLTFGDLAWVTVGIITLLIISVCVRSIAARRAENPLRRRLAAALTGATLELAGLRLGVTEQVAAELDHAADRLGSVTAAIEAAGKAAAEAQQKAVAAVSAVDPALASMTTAATSMSTAAGTLATVPGKVGEHLDRMNGKFGDVIDRASAAVDSMGSKFSDALDAMNGQAGDYLSRIGQSAIDLAAVQRDAVSAQRDLAQSSGDSSKRVADALTDGAAQVHNSLNDVGGVAMGYARRIEVAADVIGQAIGDLPSGTSKMAEAATQVETVVSQLATAIAGLKQDVATISGQISGVQSGLTAASERQRSSEPPAQFQDATRELRSSATDLRDAARALQQAMDQSRPGTVSFHPQGSRYNGQAPYRRRRWLLFRRP